MAQTSSNAAHLLQNISIPTWVTLSRLLAVPLMLAIMTTDTPNHRLIALAAFLIAALTDWLDGYLARKLNQITDLGKMLDPLVDKLLVIAALLLFVQLGQIPAWGVFVILARELVITAWRGAPVPASTAENPQETAKSQAIIPASWWGKVKTVWQMVAISWLFLQWQGDRWVFWGAVVITVVSGVVYLFPSKS
ncbi:MAG: CDP-diacylglycerol--glycerol-3-phosphate 3-phosphatidyltransferase [Pseudanabaenaceae cyanobacterium]